MAGFQQVKVGRTLEFVGDASQYPNVKGDMSPERMTSVDWFDQAALDTSNAYTLTLGGSSDLGAVTGGGENGFKGTTGNVDNDVSFLSTALIFDITQKPSIETKLKIADVSGTIVFWGFSDATLESTPAATIDADSGTVTAVATDAVGFLVDADYNTSTLYAVSVLTGGTAQVTSTGIVWTDGQSKILKVELETTGNANFYVDGVQKARILLAVADVPLCAILNYGTRANDGSNVVTKRYLKRWQDVP